MAFNKRNINIIRCLDCGAEMPEMASDKDFVRIVSEIDRVQTVECKRCKTTGTFDLPPVPEPIPETISIESVAEAVAELTEKLNDKGLIP